MKPGIGIRILASTGLLVSPGQGDPVNVCSNTPLCMIPWLNDTHIMMHASNNAGSKPCIRVHHTVGCSFTNHPRGSEHVQGIGSASEGPEPERANP